MLDFHKANNADVTHRRVCRFRMEEASRFGIVVTDENSTDYGVPGETGASRAAIWHQWVSTYSHGRF